MDHLGKFHKQFKRCLYILFVLLVFNVNYVSFDLLQYWQMSGARLAIMNCHCEDDDFYPDVTPIVMAAQKNDFTLVSLKNKFIMLLDVVICTIMILSTIDKGSIYQGLH